MIPVFRICRVCHEPFEAKPHKRGNGTCGYPLRCGSCSYKFRKAKRRSGLNVDPTERARKWAKDNRIPAALMDKSRWYNVQSVKWFYTKLVYAGVPKTEARAAAMKMHQEVLYESQVSLARVPGGRTAQAVGVQSALVHAAPAVARSGLADLQAGPGDRQEPQPRVPCGDRTGAGLDTGAQA